MEQEEKQAVYETVATCFRMNYQHEESHTVSEARDYGAEDAKSTSFRFFTPAIHDASGEVQIWLRQENKALFTPGKHYLIRVEALD